MIKVCVSVCEYWVNVCVFEPYGFMNGCWAQPPFHYWEDTCSKQTTPSRTTLPPPPQKLNLSSEEPLTINWKPPPPSLHLKVSRILVTWLYWAVILYKLVVEKREGGGRVRALSVLTNLHSLLTSQFEWDFQTEWCNTYSKLN